MIWANLFHIYQPPNWDPKIINKVATESYRPLISILKKNPQVNITININASLTEQLIEHQLDDVVKGFRDLAEKGQVEFTGSAKYHTILPLISRQEIKRQIQLNTEVNKKYFGPVYEPVGFFPPEMCYSFKISETIKELGFKWIALDEISFGGQLGQVSLDQRYQMSNGMTAIFRNRYISDYFAFSAPINKPQEFIAKIGKDDRSGSYLVTAMDGENLGHHRIGTDRLWEAAITNYKTVTFSDYLKRLKKTEVVNPLRASWSSRPEDIQAGSPYVLWYNHDNTIHMLQWPLTYLISHLVHQAEAQDDKDAGDAHGLLDAALASDQYWWASAQPWWSKEIVIRETKELLDVIKDLKTVSDTDRKQAHNLYDMIIREVERWQSEGIAQERAEEYRQRTQETKYMGGKKVI
ncbi:hypothetical protein ACFL04_00015 [Patescibacteria group bacterium]